MSSNGDNHSPAYGSCASNTTPPTSAHSCNSSRFFSFSSEPKDKPQPDFRLDTKLLFSMQSAFESPIESNGLATERVHGLLPSFSSGHSNHIAQNTAQCPQSSLHNAVTSLRTTAGCGSGGGTRNAGGIGGSGLSGSSVVSQFGRMVTDDCQWGQSAINTNVSLQNHNSNGLQFRNPLTSDNQVNQQSTSNQNYGMSPLSNHSTTGLGQNYRNDNASLFNGEFKISLPPMRTVPPLPPMTSLSSLPPVPMAQGHSQLSMCSHGTSMNSTTLLSKNNHSGCRVTSTHNAKNGEKKMFGIPPMPSFWEFADSNDKFQNTNGSYVSDPGTRSSFAAVAEVEKTEKLHILSPPPPTTTTVRSMKPDSPPILKKEGNKSETKAKFQCHECGYPHIQYPISIPFISSDSIPTLCHLLPQSISVKSSNINQISRFIKLSTRMRH